MEIIYVEDAMLRNLFLAAVDLFSISLLVAAVGALLAKRRTLMYWWVMMAGFFAFVVTLSLSLLTGNLVLLLGGIGFLAVLPLSYYRQKRIILAEEAKIIFEEEAEKERLRKIEREFKRQAVIKNVVDKVKADDYSRFMPKAENREA